MKGDTLASGGIRATFGPGKPISQEAWDAIFADFDAEAYRNNANLKKTGDVGVGPRERTKRGRL